MENRIRFPLRVLNAVCDAIGADRVGIRMSPFSDFQDMKEEDPLSLFIPWTKAIVGAQPKLAYIHCVEPRVSGDHADAPASAAESVQPIRDIVDATDVKFIAAGGLTPESGAKIIAEHGGLVALGRWYIANPDLLDRALNNLQLNPYDRSTFYTPGEKGYTE